MTAPEGAAGAGKAFLALRNTNYRYYWIGQAISLVGTWMQTVAVSWVVLKITNSAVALGNVISIQFLPMMILALVGGDLADRFPKRRVLLVTQFTMLVQSGLLFVLSYLDRLDMTALYVLTAILGIAQAFDNPTRQAIVPELVQGEKDVANAVALNSMAFNAAKIMGPAVAGVLLARFGARGCFLFNTVSYVAVLFTLFKITERKLQTKQTHSNALARIREGIRYSITSPKIASIMMISAILGVFGYNFNAIVPLLARFVLRTGPEGFGYLTAAAGIGSFIAALSLAYLGKSSRKIVMVGAFGLSLSVLGLGFASTWAANIVLLLAYGFFSIVFFASANTRLQLDAPDDIRGKISALFVLCIIGSTPIGSTIIGVLTRYTSVHTMLATMGIVCLAGALYFVGYSRMKRESLAPS